jgi:hypothetical protein
MQLPPAVLRFTSDFGHCHPCAVPWQLLLLLLLLATAVGTDVRRAVGRFSIMLQPQGCSAAI